MSATNAAAAKKDALVLGGEARVDLLPPEVRARHRAERLRWKLGVMVVGVAVIAAGGFGASLMLELQAEARLAAEQQRTEDLLAEQAQYSEVMDVNRRIHLIEVARSLGTSTEVLWKDILDEYRSALPDGAEITNAALTGRAPWEPRVEPAGPLRSDSVAQVQITATTPAVPDATAWLRRISKLPTIADASLNTIASVDDVWTTTVTFNVNVEGLADRFPGPSDAAVAPSSGSAGSGEPVEASGATGADE